MILQEFCIKRMTIPFKSNTEHQKNYTVFHFPDVDKEAYLQPSFDGNNPKFTVKSQGSADAVKLKRTGPKVFLSSKQTWELFLGRPVKCNWMSIVYILTLFVA